MPRFSRCAVLFLPLLCAGFLFMVPVHGVSADDDTNDEINSCTGTVYDADGNAYGTVKVGDQCWLDRNMNVGTMLANALTLPDESNSKMEKWCYGNAPASCFSDGGLYSWGEAMQHSASEGARGICPAGWHIPTKTEWYVLVDFLKNPEASCDQSQLDVWQCSDAGTKLKIGGSSGLNIPFGGDRGYSDYDSSAPAATFYNTDSTLMWLSSRFDKDYALFAGITQNNEAVKVRKAKDPVGNSIRCLKDTLDDSLTSLSIEIPKKSASVLSTTLPIAFTYKTTLPKIAEGTTLKNRMRIRMTDAFVTMRYDDRTEEDGMAIWKGIYERPIGIVGPFHLAGTLETADCSGDTGTKLNFDINDPTPGIHTVSAVVKDDETMTKRTFVSAEPVSLVAPAEEPSFFSKPITYILKHLFGVISEETKETENVTPTPAEPVYASLKEPDLTVAEARRLCGKTVENTGCVDGSICCSIKSGESCLFNGLVYGVVTAKDGRQWLDRNLGATQVAISSVDPQSRGWIYQWGRGNDGHQIVTSGTTGASSILDMPGNDKFIIDPSYVYPSSTQARDWRIPKNDNLWQGVNGINNPCPATFRLPTVTEWQDVATAEQITSVLTGYESTLKLIAGNYRFPDGRYVDCGCGRYWSSSVAPDSYLGAAGSSFNQSSSFSLHDSGSNVDYGDWRSHGKTVRCIKD